MGQLLDLGQIHKRISLNFFKFCVYGIRIRPYRTSFRIVTVKRIIGAGAQPGFPQGGGALSICNMYIQLSTIYTYIYIFAFYEISLFLLYIYIYALENLTHVNAPLKLFLCTLEHINSFLQIQRMKKLEIDYYFFDTGAYPGLSQGWGGGGRVVKSRFTGILY